MINLDNSSDDESKHDSISNGSLNQLIFLGEKSVSLSDDNVQKESNSGTNPSIIIPTVILVPFKEYYTNNDNIMTIDRSRYILVACFRTVDEISLELIPYTDLKKSMLPTQVMLQQEILRRSPGHKNRKMINKDFF